MAERFDIDDIRFRIAAARRILYREGCDSAVAGHVSVRVEGEDAFWITPFGYFDETVPSDVAKVGFDLMIEGGSMLVSPALQFHAAIYQQRTDVNAVIHTHSHYVSVLATNERTIGMYNAASVIFHDDQALYEDDGSHPSAEGKHIVAALGDKHVLLMRNHGAVVVSPSLENATIEALTLEKTAQYHLEAEASGGKEIPIAEIVNSKPDYDRYFRAMMWDANFRRLRRSDPDLFEYLR